VYVSLFLFLLLLLLQIFTLCTRANICTYINSSYSCFCMFKIVFQVHSVAQCLVFIKWRRVCVRRTHTHTLRQTTCTLTRSPSHTHAHMHTCTHAHMHTCTHAHMHTCTLAPTCTDARSPTWPNAHPHVHMHTRTHALSLTHARTTYIWIYLRVHSLTHIPALYCYMHKYIYINIYKYINVYMQVTRGRRLLSDLWPLNTTQWKAFLCKHFLSPTWSWSALCLSIVWSPYS